jgi:large subunit ribosomal protein L30
MMPLRVIQVRSAIGTKPKQRGTLRALGLGRIGRRNTLPDRPEIRGMIRRVPHLVKVEEVLLRAPGENADGRSDHEGSAGGHADGTVGV